MPGAVGRGAEVSEIASCRQTMGYTVQGSHPSARTSRFVEEENKRAA